MKKTLLLLTIFVATICSAQTPIASKTLSVNPALGIHQVLKVWDLNIDAKASMVTVNFEINTLTLTDSLLFVTPYQYRRVNQAEQIVGTDTIPANMKFDQLRASQVGQLISGMILQDLVPVLSSNDLGKLNQ